MTWVNVLAAAGPSGLTALLACNLSAHLVLLFGRSVATNYTPRGITLQNVPVAGTPCCAPALVPYSGTSATPLLHELTSEPYREDR